VDPPRRDICFEAARTAKHNLARLLSPHNARCAKPFCTLKSPKAAPEFDAEFVEQTPWRTGPRKKSSIPRGSSNAFEVAAVDDLPRPGIFQAHRPKQTRRQGANMFFKCPVPSEPCSPFRANAQSFSRSRLASWCRACGGKKRSWPPSIFCTSRGSKYQPLHARFPWRAPSPSRARGRHPATIPRSAQTCCVAAITASIPPTIDRANGTQPSDVTAVDHEHASFS